MKRLSFSTIILFILVWGNVSAFDNKTTHRALTKAAIEASEFKANKYLENNLNLPNGTDTSINNSKISEWLMKGSFLEDVPKCRASNHFHNPLRNWAESGMRDEPWIVDWWCSGGEYPPENIKSAVHWATGYMEPAPDGAKADTGNLWDWDHAREYFYTYLSGKDLQGNPVATTIEQREEYFAKCLQGLGQVLHLLQDIAVPAHVRDDFKSHLDWLGITLQTLFRPSEWIGERFEYYVKKHQKLIIGSIGGYLPDHSLTKFWDTNDYTGQDPDSLNSQMIGLAEYTSMNFASKNTIFTEDYSIDHVYYHPYPRKSSTNLQEYIDGNLLPETVIGEDNVPDTSFYIRKIGDGEVLDRFVKPTYFTRDIQQEPDYDERIFRRTFRIDDECAREYASKLLPRAVGYSAGLLDYFFRGTLEISIPADQVFLMIEGIAIPHWITSINARVRNTTPNEPVGNGILQAVVRYKRGSDEEYRYSVSEPITITSLSATDATEFSFDFADDPIPSGIREAYLQVIFKGTLGQEENIAIAVGMKDLFPDIIEVTLPDKGIYALTEDPALGFQGITLLARNVDPDGNQTTSGDIRLVVQYRLALDDPFQSYPVPTTEEFFYIVTPEANGTPSIPRDGPVELLFDLSANPIPLYATDVYLQVVYRGQFGLEEEAVAVGLRDISEPTPIDFFNNMDKICLYNSWYDAGSPEAIDLVDTDNDGVADLWDVYAHNLMDIYVRFSPISDPKFASPAEYNLHIPVLNAGQFSRIAFILSDYEFFLGFYITTVVKTDPDDDWVEYFPPELYGYVGIKNQTKYGDRNACCEALGIPDPDCIGFEEGCHIRHYPTFNSFRGVEMWEGTVLDNYPYPSDSSCPLELLE